MRYSRNTRTFKISTHHILMCLNDCRIYGTNISFTSTGRITMHEPNLQTVAKDIDMEFIGKMK